MEFWGQANHSYEDNHTYYEYSVNVFSDSQGHYGPANEVRALKYVGNELSQLTREDIISVLHNPEFVMDSQMQYNLGDGDNPVFLEFQYNEQNQITGVLVTDTGEYLGS